MAQVPSGTRFIGIATTADLVERKSAVLNKQTEPYTIEDIASSVTTASQGPQGVPGVQGEQGIPGTAGAVGPAGLTWRSTWVSGTSYVANDAVSYDGASWFCILATSGTTAPDLDATHWALLASQGAQGIQGIQGVQGLQGIQGIQGSPAAQTLQETVDLGNTINDGTYVTTLSAAAISNEKIGTGVSSVFSYEGLDLLKSGEILKIQAPDILTDGRNIKFPDASGTIALTSDVTLQKAIAGGNVVPFNTIWNTDGGNNIRVNPDGIKFDSPFSPAFGVFSSGEMLYSNGTTYIAIKTPTTISPGNKTITFPDATGTVALVSYKVYVALLEFVNGSTITATVLQNTIGNGSADGVNDIAWSFNAPAQPKATMTSGSPFTSNKTICVNSMYMQGNVAYSLAGYRINSTQVRFYSSQISDSTSGIAFVPNVYVEIRVYN